MQIAIIADWLPVFAGAEHVIAEFHALWPNAPIFTTLKNPEKIGPLRDATIHTTYLQYPYSLTKKHPWLLPWMPRAIETIDLTGFDTILSSSHAIGKGVVPPSTARHVCYCHTPMRYAWEMEDEYLDDFNIPQALRRVIKKKLKHIRRWDLTSAQRVDIFIANSSAVQERIRRVYNRDAVVIHPPVSERFFDTPQPENPSKDYYLAIGRMVPYKRFDLLIETANRLGIPLKVAGSGQEFARLKAMAGPTVEMLGFVPDEDLPSLYANATALLFPQFEDAGVVPLEAQACGTPVIAYGKGGVLDTVKNGETGLHFSEQTVDSLADAIREFESMSFEPQTIAQFASQFRAKTFQKKISDIILSCA